MLKSEILKLIDSLRDDPEIFEIHTAELPGGKWAPVILVMKKSGEFAIMKKKGLTVFESMEVSRVIKIWMDAFELKKNKINFVGMNG